MMWICQTWKTSAIIKDKIILQVIRGKIKEKIILEVKIFTIIFIVISLSYFTFSEQL